MPAATSSTAGRAPTAEALAGRLRLDDLDVAGARVLVRADLNVPVRDGEVGDMTRIHATLPTLRVLMERGARVLVASHRGRPRGMFDRDASLEPVARCLRRELGVEVPVVEDCIGDGAEAAASRLGDGEILLLENLRFHPGERDNDPDFARALGSLADLFVNDAFGACHREHASIVGVPRYVQRSAAGRLLALEVERLSRVLTDPEPPFALVLGGAKVSDKVGLIGHLLPAVQRILVGGAMANAFLAAGGREIGDSLAPEGAIEEAGKILEEAREQGVDVILPTDLVVAPAIDRPEEAEVVEDAVPDGRMALDIGPDSRRRFAEALSDARTIVWNGPIGVFEEPAFAAGSRRVAEAIAARTSSGYTVLGGGDTAAAAAAAGVTERVSHVSTGGGASLDLLSGRVLPGVAALSERLS